MEIPRRGKMMLCYFLFFLKTFLFCFKIPKFDPSVVRFCFPDPNNLHESRKNK